jgi:4-hydroxy-tetrahydrodipicolinate synthase
VASHIVGPEMRRMVDEPENRRDIHDSLSEVFAALFCTASPAPVKSALAMIGHPVGGVRLPLVEVDEEQAEIVRGALERHGLLQTAKA